MTIGERNYLHPMVHVPPWSSFSDNPTVDISPYSSSSSLSPTSNSTSSGGGGYFAAFQRFLPSNGNSNLEEFLVEGFDSDKFRIFEFKVKKCTKGRSHDWTECPYAHPGEKARRRDPIKYRYSGTACPDFRKGNCGKGDACEFSHGVFECWLHPARYRTQPCKDGMNCKRRVCFFAHSPDQLRVLSPRAAVDSYDGSPPPSESPPMSPINEMVASLRQLQLNKVKSMQSSCCLARPCYCSLPTTPTRAVARPGIGYFDSWDNGGGGYCEEEPVMERVESGRGLRAKMFEKLCKENPLDRMAPNLVGNGSYSDAPKPDVGWVSDLIQNLINC